METRMLLVLPAILTGWMLQAPRQGPPEGESAMALKLESPAFEDTQRIPPKYTCDGEDISPPLKWSGAPRGTRTLALIMDDPDAPVGTWVHWVVFNIPEETTGLAENVPKTAGMPDGKAHGKNSWKRFGYGGPCPPSGTHRYFFKLFALDSELGLSPGATKEDLLKSMEGKILEEAGYMGLYSRSR